MKECTQAFGHGGYEACFALRGPGFEDKLKQKGVEVPHKYTSRLVASNQGNVVAGPHRSFLKPGSTLLSIPGERQARRKDSVDAVYRRAIHIRKEAITPKVRDVLQRGKVIV